MDDLLHPHCDKPNGMGSRAGASVVRIDRVRDMIFEVSARNVLTIPARLEYDMHEEAIGAMAVWECVRLYVGPFVVET